MSAGGGSLGGRRENGEVVLIDLAEDDEDENSAGGGTSTTSAPSPARKRKNEENVKKLIAQVYKSAEANWQRDKTHFLEQIQRLEAEGAEARREMHEMRKAKEEAENRLEAECRVLQLDVLDKSRQLIKVAGENDKLRRGLQLSETDKLEAAEEIRKLKRELNEKSRKLEEVENALVKRGAEAAMGGNPNRMNILTWDEWQRQQQGQGGGQEEMKNEGREEEEQVRVSLNVTDIKIEPPQSLFGDSSDTTEENQEEPEADAEATGIPPVENDQGEMEGEDGALVVEEVDLRAVKIEHGESQAVSASVEEDVHSLIYGPGRDRSLFGLRQTSGRQQQRFQRRHKRLRNSQYDDEICYLHREDKSKRGPGYFRCCCGMEFTGQQNICNHVSYHNNEWKMRCRTCMKRCSSMIGLKRHLMDVHGHGRWGMLPSQGTGQEQTAAVPVASGSPSQSQSAAQWIWNN